jgi:hypothetical protein
MSDPAILFVKPQAISDRDKKALQKAGVIVVEIADPASVKFTRAAAEISGSEMLMVALRAIKERQDEQIYNMLGREISETLLKTHKAPRVSTGTLDAAAQATS